MGTFYRDALARQGYEETATAVARHWASGDRETAVDAIGDRVLDGLAAAGHPEECRERLAAFERVEGVDAVSVGFPRAADAGELAATADALAPG